LSDSPVPAQYLATLYEITRKLNSSLELKDILDYVMDRVIDVTGAERGFLMLWDDSQGTLNFKVARGIAHQDLEKPKFQVSRTIVRHVAETGEPILTDNAQNQFSEMESVVMMALRSILCVPIKVKTRLLGVVYVDNRMFEGAFDQGHYDLVTSFASQAGVAIENANLYQVAVEKGRLQRELEMARNIQRELLPQDFPVLDGYEVAVHWDSANEVAGDFYDCFLINDSMQMVIADVSGKGAPAAIFMAVARSLIRGSAFSTPSPEDTLRNANKLIIDDAGTSGMFVTLYYSVFLPDGRFIGINNGHNQPLLWRASQATGEWVPRGGRALGWFDDLPLERFETQLSYGDILIFYTDGLTEAETTDHLQYGEDRLVELMQALPPGASAAQIRDIILKSVTEFVGDAPPFDDRTLMIVRYTPS